MTHHASTERVGELMLLKNNEQLYDYLLSMIAKLNARGAAELSRVVMDASRHAAAVPKTEFLGESRVALKRVKEEQIVLTQEELSELGDVVRQLDEAFSQR
jgi:hypothetical protein